VDPNYHCALYSTGTVSDLLIQTLNSLSGTLCTFFTALCMSQNHAVSSSLSRQRNNRWVRGLEARQLEQCPGITEAFWSQSYSAHIFSANV